MYADAPQLQPPEPFTLFRATALKTWMLAQLDAHPDGLVLDLSSVDNIDTAGVQLLLMIKREAESRACPLTISAPSEPVRALFQLFGLDMELDEAARSPGE